MSALDCVSVNSPAEPNIESIVDTQRRVTTGHNGDDGRSYFSGFLLRQQGIGTRGHLTLSWRLPSGLVCADPSASRQEFTHAF